MRRLLSSLAVLALLAACQKPPPPPQAAIPQPTLESQIIVPAHGAYTGSYIDFGDSEDDVTLESIDNFETAVHKHQAIIASSSFWGQQSFPRRNLDIIARHNSIPLIYWSPWDKPYMQDRGPDRFNLVNILAGKWDAYIDSWADQAKAFGRPFFVAWGLEMNGTWFPWSGWFYGGGAIIDSTQFVGPNGVKIRKAWDPTFLDALASDAPSTPGTKAAVRTQFLLNLRGLAPTTNAAVELSLKEMLQLGNTIPRVPVVTPAYAGPEYYKKAYRYVVDRVRARGAKNIVWVFHLNNYSYPLDMWNVLKSYYPGDDYVDWLGISAYGKQFNHDIWISAEDSFTYAYDDLCALSPNKPVMFAEWGIGEFPSAGSKADWLTDAFEIMSHRLPRLKAAVFWNERWENDDGSYSNLRATSSQQSLAAYIKGVSNPYWIGEPRYTNTK